jgi:hypothetical protein
VLLHTRKQSVLKNIKSTLVTGSRFSARGLICVDLCNKRSKLNDSKWVERIQLNSACISKTSTDPPRLMRGFSSDNLVVSHLGRKYTSTARNHYSSQQYIYKIRGINSSASQNKTLKASTYQRNVNYNVILHSTYTFSLFVTILHIN